MKNSIKFLIPCFIGMSTIGLAQDKIYTIDNVDKMVIYPGCENNQDNEQLKNCFNKKIQLDIVNLLKDSKLIDQYVDKENITFTSNAKFEINSEGKIVNLSVKGDQELNDFISKAFQDLNENFISKNQYISPAQNKNGQKVTMEYQLPVRLAIM